MGTGKLKEGSGVFVCGICGNEFTKWDGRCSACGEWNTLKEVPKKDVVFSKGRGTARAKAAFGKLFSLKGEAGEALTRFTSTFLEVDRVLGGGFVPGSVVLLGGDPGIGKSTLALEIASGVGDIENPTLYVTGEETVGQIRLRASRTKINEDGVKILEETDLDTIINTIQNVHPMLAIVDSIQTCFNPEVSGYQGNTLQVKEAAARLKMVAKEEGSTILIVGHVTKDGAIAGPQTLAHLVDVVLFLEGEKQGEYRLLRGFKNRFGPTDELGLFNMLGEGMVEVGPSGLGFLDETTLGMPGNILAICSEGIRPLVVEIQALVVPSTFSSSPRRTAVGFDLSRMNLLLAVLEKRCGIVFTGMDVYLNVVGGFKILDNGADLPVALALASAKLDKALIQAGAFGEVGLAGEVRKVKRPDARIGAGKTLGLKVVICPKGNSSKSTDITLRPVMYLKDAIKCLV